VLTTPSAPMRPSLLCFSLLLLSLQCASQTHQPEPLGAALLGCWRIESATFLAADGQTFRLYPKCTAEFSMNRFVNRCLPPAPQRIEYSYSIQQNGVISTKMIAHLTAPSLIGLEQMLEFNIVNDRLQMTAHPQTAKPFPVSSARRIDSIFVRQDWPGECRPSPAF